MLEININLDHASYPINIGEGIIKTVVNLVKSLKVARKCFIITDDNVAKLYADSLIESIQEREITVELAVVKCGEAAKSFAVAEELFSQAIRAGLDRKSPIIALGGGVVGDLAGFIAANYLRGVPFIQIPTTLLAQVDASIGGKVAINHPFGKNLIGAFYQPEHVIIDTGTLKTLPDIEYISGIAEIIKYGFILDNNFFFKLEDKYEEVLAKRNTVLTEMIWRSCILKKRIIEQDEREDGPRMLLNFGHTIGHAIEVAKGFNHYSHGKAVVIGGYCAILISSFMGLCDDNVVKRAETIYQKYKLPITINNIDKAEIINGLYRDKKVVNGKINWVLLKDIGQAVICDTVTEQLIFKALDRVLE